jgi:preprotein translocase subunit YajC
MSSVHVIAVSGIHNLATLTGPVLAATAKKSSASPATLIFFVLLFGVGYMFLIRPQRQRRQRAMQVNKQISVGDKVVLSSGIMGRVEGFVGDHARIEIAPGTVIEVLRQAVSQRVEDPVEGAVQTDASPPGSPPYDNHSASYDDHSHDDLVDDSGHDPYSVAPLEDPDKKDPGEESDGHSTPEQGGGR